MAKATVDSTTLIVVTVVGGGLLLYTLWWSGRAADRTGSWVAEQTESLGGKVWGAPEYLWKGFWHETTGQGGLGITGEDPVPGERTILGKDPDSWGFGYGPKKGWLLG